MNDQEILEHGIYLLLDNELDDELRIHILARIHKNTDLKKAYNEIKNCKNAVALSYDQEIPQSNFHSLNKNRMPIAIRFAASITLIIGLTAGWVGNDLYQQKVERNDISVAVNKTNESTTVSLASLSQVQTRKIMFHINSENLIKANQTLKETKTILRSYAESAIPIKIDFMMDQQAVKLFGPKYIAQLKEIGELIKQYDNINFYACSKSLHDFSNDIAMEKQYPDINTHHDVDKLIPQRLKEGWIYIQA